MALIIPYFIPHLGCPHQCLFCNQHAITGIASKKDEPEEDLLQVIKTWLPRKKKGQEVQLAFYGGSFTCLPERVIIKFLSSASPFLISGEIQSIRLSTRPDCISPETCKLLKKYGVKIVELGVQSMDDNVLDYSQRGHSRSDCVLAIKELQEHDFQVGVQLLPGLPNETSYSFMKGVRKIIELKPSFVRLYPALVVKGSGLEELYNEKKYNPLTLNQAIAWTSRAKDLFEGAKISVIRMGLQHSKALESEYVAGPHHPAFGELVASRKWFKKIRKILSSCPMDKKMVVRIAEKDLSAFNGPKKINIKRLEALHLARRMDLQVEQNLKRGTLEYAVG